MAATTVVFAAIPALIYLAAGLPVVAGEHTSPGGGYHYYPAPAQVAEWVRQAGLRRLEDGVGDDYYHLLAEASPAAAR